MLTLYTQKSTPTPKKNFVKHGSPESQRTNVNDSKTKPEQPQNPNAHSERQSSNVHSPAQGSVQQVWVNLTESWKAKRKLKVLGGRYVDI